MRQHVGAHILKENLLNACDYCCGGQGCSINITVGSGRGQTASGVPQSPCQYSEKFSIKSASKGSKTSICTNTPKQCKVCKRVFWYHNMFKHFESSHPDYPRDEWIIKDDDKTFTLNLVISVM